MATARDIARFGQLYLQARIGLQSVGGTRYGLKPCVRECFFRTLMAVLEI